MWQVVKVARATCCNDLDKLLPRRELHWVLLCFLRTCSSCLAYGHFICCSSRRAYLKNAFTWCPVKRYNIPGWVWSQYWSKTEHPVCLVQHKVFFTMFAYSYFWYLIKFWHHFSYIQLKFNNNFPDYNVRNLGTHIVWMQNRVSQRCFISLIVRPLPWAQASPVQSDGRRDGRSVGRLLLCSVFVHSILIKDKPSSRLALLWLSVIATLTREPLNLVGFLWHMLPGRAWPSPAAAARTFFVGSVRLERNWILLFQCQQQNRIWICDPSACLGRCCWRWV